VAESVAAFLYIGQVGTERPIASEHSPLQRLPAPAHWTSARTLDSFTKELNAAQPDGSAELVRIQQ
jgi:hypothetical protein